MDLLNSTLLNGNARPINGGGSWTIAYSSSNGDLYVGGYAIQIVNGSSQSVLGAIPSAGQTSACSALAYDSGNGLLYEATQGSTVAVFNLSTGKMVANMGVGVGPVAIAYDPQNGFLYTANSNSSNISVINGTLNRVVGTLTAGISPVGIAYDPRNGYLYVADFDYYGVGNVTVVDPRNGSVVSTIAVGEWPAAVAYDSQDNLVYVATQYHPSISVINASNNSVIASVVVGGYPTALAYDPALDRVYVAGGGGTDSVVVINGSNHSVIATLGTGLQPDAIAYDSGNGAVYVVNYNDDSLTVIDGAGPGAPRVVDTIQLSINPRALAFDAADHRLYVVDYFAGGDYTGAGGLTSISTESSTVLGFTRLNGNPIALAYDGGNDRVYVANYIGNNVTVFNASSGQRVGGIGVGLQPDAVIYDPVNGMVYIANGGSNNLTVVDGSTDTVVGSIPVGPDPVSGVFDSTDHRLYVVNFGNHTLTAVDTSTETIAGSIIIGGYPAGIAYDSANGLIYVASQWRGALSVVDPSNSSLVGWIGTGGQPGAVLYDSTDGYLYVANKGGQNLTVVNASGGGVVGSVSVGTYPADLAYATDTDTLDVANFQSGTVSFARVSTVITPTYPVTFSEAGLPPGTLWGVTLGGLVQTSAGPSIQFTTINGSYPFVIGVIPGFVASAESGTITVNGGGVGLQVVFTPLPPLFPVRFIESGLPGGEQFYVDLGGIWNASSGGAVEFVSPNGTYAFDVSSAGPYLPNPASGWVRVNGQSVVLPVVFSQPPSPRDYSVRFTETGLPYGTLWGVALVYQTLGSTNGSVATALPNGSFEFSILSPTGYVPNPGHSVFRVQGSDQSIAITFAPAGSSQGPLRAFIDFSIRSASCLSDGGVTNDVLLGANITGGIGPYEVTWVLPTGNATGALAETTTTWGLSTIVVLAVTDSTGAAVSQSLQLPMWLPSCGPPAVRAATLAPGLDPLVWVVTGLTIGLIGTTLLALWLFAKPPRPPKGNHRAVGPTPKI